MDVKVGIMGSGNIGRVHLEGFKDAGAEVVALCDVDEKRTRALAEEFDVPGVYTDYRRMLEEADINTVSVCTPNVFHAPMSIAALEAGKHVICEKPLSINAIEAEKIVQAASASGKKFMVAFCNRFRADTQLLKSFIESGELGRIYYAKAAWLRRRGIPGFGGWFTNKETAGGGPLIDLGVHMLDLTLWLMGNPQARAASGSVYAEFGPRGLGAGTWGFRESGGKYDVEDLAVGFIRLENGAALHLEASWASNVEKDASSVVLMGDEGGAVIDTSGVLKIHKEMHGAQVDIIPQLRPNKPHKVEIVHFVDCIREDKEPMATGEQGLEVMRILDAIYQSSATGQEVAIER